MALKSFILGGLVASVPCITILIWNDINSSSASPIPSSLIPAENEYSWKSSLPKEFAGITSGNPVSLKNVNPNSSRLDASSVLNILNNTFISYVSILFAEKNTLNAVAGFSRDTAFVK